MGGVTREMKKQEERQMNSGSGCGFILTWSVKVKHTYHTEGRKKTPQGLKVEAYLRWKQSEFFHMVSLINNE